MVPNRVKIIFFGLVVFSIFKTYSANTTFENIVYNSTGNDTVMLDVKNETTTEISCDVPLTCNFTNFNATSREANCLCDEQCSLYDECCPDAKYQTQYFEKSELPVFECVYLLYDSYYVVQSCPKSWNGTSEKCELSKQTNRDVSKIEHIPVTNMANNITFGNLYCAECNKVDVNNLKYWGIDMSCNFQLTDKEHYTSDLSYKSKMKLWSTESGNNITASCNSNLVIPRSIEPRLRTCTSDLIKSCSKNWTDIEVADRCSNYTSFAYYYEDYDSFSYKNLDCAICNYRDPLNITFCIKIQGIAQAARTFSEVFKIETKTGVKCASSESGNDGFVSIIGVILSIIFIILHLIVFSMVKHLRNFSGKCVTSYACALMFGYISYCLWEIAKGSFCIFIAISTYYSFLSAFLWMLVMAYDVCVTIHGATFKLQYSSGKKETRFLIYSLFCWGVPFIFVILSLIVDSLSEEIIIPKPLYGQSGTCWFGSGSSLLVFFVFPCTLIITINIILFSWTSYLIFSNRQETSTRVKKEHGDFRLYGRLAILMGLTWTTGVLANCFDYDDLWVVFSLLNTTQGIFIFGAFSYKQKSINVVKQRFSSSKVGGFLSGTTTSSSVVRETELTTS